MFLLEAISLCQLNFKWGLRFEHCLGIRTRASKKAEDISLGGNLTCRLEDIPLESNPSVLPKP